MKNQKRCDLLSCASVQSNAANVNKMRERSLLFRTDFCRLLLFLVFMLADEITRPETGGCKTAGDGKGADQRNGDGGGRGDGYAGRNADNTANHIAKGHSVAGTGKILFGY